MKDERGRGGALGRSAPLSFICLLQSFLPPFPALRVRRVILLPVMMSAPFFLSARRVLGRALLVTAGVTAMTACGGALPAARAPGAAPTASAPVDLLATPWRLGNGRAARTQRIQVEAQLTSRVDSTIRTDSVASDLIVSWGDDGRAGTAALPVRLVGYAVRVAPDTAWRVPPGVTIGAELSVTPMPGAVPALCAATAPTCTTSNIAAVQGWQESWLGLPSAMEPGTTWRDSTTYTVLRDSIPLTVTSVREFTVREAVRRERAVVLIIDRRSTQQLAGEGRQFGEAVRITGSGEGVMRLEVALTNGAVLRGDGTSVLTLQLVGRRRTQELTQESHLTITAP
jgi:hypothetical protein